MVPDHIEEYNIEQDFIWKTFPIQDKKLSVLIVYDPDKEKDKLHSTINKLLKVFPTKCYYDNDKLTWLILPKDTEGFRANYLEKVINKKIDTHQHTLILDLDNHNLEDPEEFKEFPIIETKKKENREQIIPLFSLPDDRMRENIEITKITEGKTFITHCICFGDYKKLKPSYYEKFDVLMFTNSKIASYFSATRTNRMFSINNEEFLNDKIFMIDTRLMKNNMCFYHI